MNNDVIRITYRLSKKLHEEIVKAANKQRISVNAEINTVLYEYFIERQKK